MMTPLRTTIAALVCAAATAVTAFPAGADDAKPMAIYAENGSNQSGTVTLTQKDADVLVVVKLKNEPAGASEPMHIHGGTCEAPASVKWPLKNVVDGASSTLVKGVTVDALVKGGYVVNVHKSAADLGTYVACGAL